MTEKSPVAMEDHVADGTFDDCPFCGNRPKIKYRVADDKGLAVPVDVPGHYLIVVCDLELGLETAKVAPGCGGPKFSGWSFSQIRDKWNRRAPSRPAVKSGGG